MKTDVRHLINGRLPPMKKRQTVLVLLSLALLACGLWALSGAAGDTVREVSTWAQLQQALDSSGSIRLTADITAGSGDRCLIVYYTNDLDLNGYTIDRHLSSSTTDGYVFYVSGSLTISDSSPGQTGKITGGYAEAGGGICVTGSSQKAKLTLTGGSITGNRSSAVGSGGAGIRAQYCDIVISGGKITGNTANANGGGVYLYGAQNKYTTLTMTGGEISGNTAGSNGGGIYSYLYTTVTINGGTVSDNTANENTTTDGAGGGVFVAGSLSLNGGVICRNSAARGGGVASTSSFSMTDGTISGNLASSLGGGIFLGAGTANMSGGSISGNSGARGGGIFILRPDNPGSSPAIRFAVSGGAVQDNTASRDDSSGIEKEVCTELAVSGSPVITDTVTLRRSSSSEASLPNVITPEGSLSAGQPVSVKTAGVVSPSAGSPVVITSGLPGCGTYADFASGSSQYAVGLDSSGEAVLCVPCAIAAAASPNGTLTVPESAAQGIPVTVAVEPEADYALSALSFTDESGAAVSIGISEAPYTFVMPASDTTVSAAFVFSHTLVHHAAMSAGCTADGNTEYWTCSGCGKYFSDEEGTAEITAADTVIAAPGHVPGEPVPENEVPATYYAEGSYDEVVRCTVCDAELSREHRTVARLVRIIDTGTIADGSITWTLDSTGLLDISGAGAIPDYSANNPSIGLAPWYYLRENGVNIFIDKISVGSGITVVGNFAFYASPAREITLADSVERIGTAAFMSCYDLEDISIPDSVSSIGETAFFDCNALKELHLPAGLTVLASRTAYRCTSLQSVTLPDSITEIGSGAFEGCSNLAEIGLPANLEQIGQGAFSGCGQLTSLTLPAGVSSISEGAFSGCPNLENVSFAGTNTAYTFLDDLLYTADLKTLIWCPAWKESVSLPDTLKTVGAYAFSRCAGLTRVSIPGNVTKINGYAFENCTGLAEVVLPEGVTRLNEHTFAYCSSLDAVTVPSGVTYINYSCFFYCTGLRSVTFLSSDTAFSGLGSPFKGCSGFCFHAHEGSTAQEYAEEHSIPFTAIHFPVPTEAKAATCTEAGNLAYWTCSACGALFLDEAGTEETDAEAVVLPACHDFGEWARTADPTCTEPGTDTRTCSRCGAAETASVNALGHDLGHHPAAAAACTADGNTEYWTCSRCRKYFCDGEGSAEITAADTVIGMLGHDFGEWVRTADPTCTEPGTDTHTCSRCGAKETREAAAYGHTPENIPGVPETCTENGLTAGRKCSVCGEILEAQAVIPAAHVPSTVPSEVVITLPCCEAEGQTDDVIYCQRCHEELSRETRTVPALGHTPGDAVAEVVAEPGCETDGETDDVVYCTVCGKEISREPHAVPMTGHAYGNLRFVWSENSWACDAVETCGNCHTERTVATGLVTVTVARSPAEDEPGFAVCTASFENGVFKTQEQTVEIPALNDMDVLVLPAKLAVIRREAFAGVSCEAVIIPEGCREIKPDAFAGCKNLIYVRVPASTAFQPESTFAGCRKVIIDIVQEQE